MATTRAAPPIDPAWLPLVQGSGYNGLVLAIDDRGCLVASPVVVMGPGKDPLGVAKIETAQVGFTSTQQLQSPGLWTNALLCVKRSDDSVTHVTNGVKCDGSAEAAAVATAILLRCIHAEDAGFDHMARGYYMRRVVGVANTALPISLEISNLHSTLDIHMACSAGTATLTVEVSADGVHYLTLDTLAAALTTIAHYSERVLPVGLALNVLAWRYLRLTAGAAGAGNTVTLTVGAK